ncbi:TOX high mobility group box family member 4-B-like [Culicoides brevitarsis]|uniref:TOX high mobility group box family member 4-B-like n=1 Tax=Culicoides brevitarsis TaxID=469753 RepID=UPI00307BDF3C
MPPLFALTIEPTNAQEVVTIDLVNSTQEEEEAEENPPNMTQTSDEGTVTSDEVQFEESVLTKCICQGCENPPKNDENLEGVLCSNECAVKYSRDVFRMWVQSQQINPQQHVK